MADVHLTEPRQAFVRRLYADAEQRNAEKLAEQRANDQQRVIAAPHIRAFADRVVARELAPDEIRQAAERLAREFPYFSFIGPNGQMFLNQLVSAARDAARSDELLDVLSRSLRMPESLAAATETMNRFLAFVDDLREAVKRQGAIAGWRVPFFLSYFWEAGDRDRYPVIYPSTWTALERLGFVGRWPPSPAEAYALATSWLLAIRDVLAVGTWEVEHFCAWLAELPFAGIDPEDFERLARNVAINRTHVPGEGYPDPEMALEAKTNIDEVLRHLKALQAAVKPEVLKLFQGDFRPYLAGARSSWDPVSPYRDEAWMAFNSRADGGWGPALQVGITPGHVYWGFSFGGETKDVRGAWSRAAAAFEAARQAGARILFVPLQGEPYEIPVLTLPAGAARRTIVVGWMLRRNDPALSLPGLVNRVTSDLRHFEQAVHALVEESAQPGEPPRAAFDLIGAVADLDWLPPHGQVLEERGRAAMGWSFRLRPELRPELRGRQFWLYVYADGQVRARVRVVDWRAAEAGGSACPWPELAPDRDVRALGDGAADEIGQWFLIDRIEQLDEPLALDAFQVFDAGVPPVPAALRSGFTGVVRLTSGVDRWGALARAIYSDQELVLELQELLVERRQLIFYGPPGTGKTFVARRFAETFTMGRGDVQVVQFHPSYSYEEFVEGLRPEVGEDGALRYTIKPGVLRGFADRAREDEAGRYVLIIDEINRANLSRVFGELFYLLEYRDAHVTLPYSGQPFSLPGNLFVIGTMNTSDRSIALVDFALRRRFGFVGFYPDANVSPLRAYLREHGKEEYGYVADMLAEVNRAIPDPDFHLGHSYFMLDDPEALTEARIERTWRYSVVPYLREYWYDNPGVDLRAYEFGRLRDRVLGRGDGATSRTTPGSTGMREPDGASAPD